MLVDKKSDVGEMMTVSYRKDHLLDRHEKLNQITEAAITQGWYMYNRDVYSSHRLETLRKEEFQTGFMILSDTIHAPYRTTGWSSRACQLALVFANEIVRYLQGSDQVFVPHKRFYVLL